MGVSERTLYAWKSKYGGLEVNEARRLRELERENGALKKLVADLSLDKEENENVPTTAVGIQAANSRPFA